MFTVSVREIYGCFATFASVQFNDVLLHFANVLDFLKELKVSSKKNIHPPESWPGNKHLTDTG